MTPLEKARAIKGVNACIECEKCVTIRGTYYCEESGKILLPMFTEHGAAMGCSIMKWKFERNGGQK
jgi:hypothetical protein